MARQKGFGEGEPNSSPSHLQMVQAAIPVNDYLELEPEARRALAEAMLHA